MPRQKMTKRSDGRYLCRYDGHCFYGRSIPEAEKKRDEYIAREALGYDESQKDACFKDYANKWLLAYRTKCSPQVRHQYETMIAYATDHLGKARLRNITAMDIRVLYNSLEGRSQSYISKFVGIIRGIFRAAVRDGIIIRNPAEDMNKPSGTKGEHRNLEMWEKELIIQTCHDHDFGLCAMTMLFAGLRRGEALYLDVDRDVDFNKMTITVRGAVAFVKGNQPSVSSGKTAAAARVIPLNIILAHALKGHHGLLCS